MRFFRQSRHFESASESIPERLERLQIFEEEMRTMRETLLSVHRAMDKPKFSNNKKRTGTYKSNLSTANIMTDIEMDVELMFPHLDLAIGNNFQPTPKIRSQNPRFSCPNL